MALRDLFSFPGRPRSDRPASAAAISAPPTELDRALHDLGRLAVDRPELAPAAATLADVVRAVFATAQRRAELTPHADPGVIVSAWRAGVPAFRAGDAPIALDGAALAHRALALCSALPGRTPARRMEAALNDRTLDLAAWARAALADDAPRIDAEAEALGIAPAFALSTLRLVLLPELAPRSAWLATIRPEGAWTRGECPNCGEPPVLAEARGLDQRRHLRCGLCAADWPGERLRCPFCDETDHRRLGYRFVEGEEGRYRLAICESCGGRLPVASTLGPISPPGLLVAELATAHLNALAEERRVGHGAPQRPGGGVTAPSSGRRIARPSRCDS